MTFLLHGNEFQGLSNCLTKQTFTSYLVVGSPYKNIGVRNKAVVGSSYPENSKYEGNSTNPDKLVDPRSKRSFL